MASGQSKRTYTSHQDVCGSLPTRFYDMNMTFRSAATVRLKPTWRRSAASSILRYGDYISAATTG